MLGPLSKKAPRDHREPAALSRTLGRHRLRLQDGAARFADVIAFIEQDRAPGPLDLMGHSRGGHIAVSCCRAAPDRCAGRASRASGDLDASLIEPGAPPPPPMPLSLVIPTVLQKHPDGKIDDALKPSSTASTATVPGRG